jgi:hypothetical protein
MPIGNLDLRNSQVQDLTSIRGMPLHYLSLKGCTAVHDVSAIEGMKLETLYVPPTVSKGMPFARQMTSLKTIDGKPAAQFWKESDVKKAGKEARRSGCGDAFPGYGAFFAAQRAGRSPPACESAFCRISW